LTENSRTILGAQGRLATLGVVVTVKKRDVGTPFPPHYTPDLG